MTEDLSEYYLNIVFYSLSTKSKKVIQRRINLLTNLKNRHKEKIHFNQEKEWEVLKYSSKRVLENDLNVLESANHISKIYDKYFDSDLNKIINNSLFLTIVKTSDSLLKEEYLNSIIQEKIIRNKVNNQLPPTHNQKNTKLFKGNKSLTEDAHDQATN